MLAFEKAFCRVYQKVFFLFQCCLDWSEPQLLTGPGAVKKLPALIKEKGLNKVLIVTDKGLTGLGLPNGLYEELTKTGIGYVVYDGVQPNPSIDNIEEARQMYVDNGCEGIIAFGGG